MSKPQLFCFTYAGGNASFFDEIEKELRDCEIVKLEYSGHGTRHKEHYYKDFDELADDLFRIFKENYKGQEYALLGYSMGTISLVEVLKRILNTPDMRKPKRAFLSAHHPDTKKELIGFAEDELDEWVKKRTIQFGAIPEKLVNNKSFWRLYLPLYRADYSILGRYSFEKLDLKTVVPATFFYSEDDTPREKMEKWRKYFVGNCEYFEFTGNHFFIKNHYQEMADIIRQRLRQGETENDI